ncbi:MAG TPA: putative quinol monooxygenase [Acidimicrobiales bacterium]|nr:putative quinol monooxygenase [Acidimicrobiales bacterium]
MIIITGAVSVRPEHDDEAVRLCIEHSRRSRTEPGCLHHAVHRDLEDDRRLVFLERWADRDAVDAHFAVPASLEFVTAVSALASEPPTLEIHDVGDSPA